MSPPHYEYDKAFLVAANGSLNISGSLRVCCIRVCCRSVHGPMCCESVPCPEFHVGCRLGRELFTLPVCCRRCPWSHGLRPKKLYHTCSVAVTPAPARFPTQRPLVPNFTSVVGWAKLFHQFSKHIEYIIDEKFSHPKHLP